MHDVVYESFMMKQLPPIFGEVVTGHFKCLRGER